VQKDCFAVVNNIAIKKAPLQAAPHVLQNLIKIQKIIFQ